MTMSQSEATIEPVPTRLGPRPLPLHLLAAHSAWMSSLAALPLLKTGSHDWKLNPALTSLVGDLSQYPTDHLTEAIGAEILRRCDRLLRGIAAYRHHPYHRNLPAPAAIWHEGGSVVRDYGVVKGDETRRAHGQGRPVLFVPSLVNRAYILDLSERRSFLRWLARQGLRPLLLDWGEPGEVERRFDLTDYIAGRLIRALEAMRARFGAPMPLVGYCMGGLLAVAAAERRPDAVTSVTALATPWDFHAEEADQVRLKATMITALRPWLALWGEMPVDLLQALFTSLDPLLAARKFAGFARLDTTSDKALDFVALEDWLNDGVPLAAAVAAECIGGWYGDNSPAHGTWRIAGQPVRPGRIDRPSLHVIPSQDRIVPPASSRALAEAMPGSERIEPPLGHIGMMVGGSARPAVWEPLAAWLAAN